MLGRELALPVVLGPTGLMRMVAHEGERAAAVAAERAGTVSVTSSGSSVSFEDVAASVARPQWFQLYPWGDRRSIESLIGRARDCGYEAMVVTVDVPVTGAREKDLRNGLTVPPQVNARTGWDLVRHPRWLARLVAHPRPTFANFTAMAPPGRGTSGLAAYTNGLLNPGHTWRDLEWMIGRFDGPVMLKGVMTAEDARRAVEVGCGAHRRVQPRRQAGRCGARRGRGAPRGRRRGRGRGRCAARRGCAARRRCGQGAGPRARRPVWSDGRGCTGSPQAAPRAWNGRWRSCATRSTARSR